MGRRSGDVVAGMVVWAVAFASFAVQMVMTSASRAWSWDEAIYLSQVSPGQPALPFVASRARGITVLVAPLTAAGAPGWMVRVGFALASSAVLALMFRVWVPSVGMAAPIGAALFAVSWPALFYGSEVMPNLWAALLGVGMAGCLIRLVGDEAGSRGLWAGLTVTAALMASMRPPDALVLALALGAAMVVFERRAWRALVPLIAGVIAGALPWLIEMSARFGGPVEALRQAREVSHLAGDGSGVSGHLALTDGPLLGPDPAGGIPVAGALWWLGLAALIVAGLAMERRGQRTTAVRFAAIGGAALAIEYVILVSGLAPRFLLPALALLSLGAGCGLDALRRSAGVRRVVAAGVAVFVGVGVVWQLDTLRTLETRAGLERAEPQAVGAAIARELGLSRTCVVASTHDYPQVAFEAGCQGWAIVLRGGRVSGPLPTIGATLIVSRSPVADARLDPIRVPGMPSGWFVHRAA